MADKGSLFLIHGMGRLRWSMGHFIPLGQREGYKVFNYGYKAKAASIQEHGEQLAEFICASSKDENLFFITHSLGSIIFRYALALGRLGEGRRIIRAVMLGPPNQGSLVAKKTWQLALAFKSLWKAIS